MDHIAYNVTLIARPATTRPIIAAPVSLQALIRHFFIVRIVYHHVQPLPLPTTHSTLAMLVLQIAMYVHLVLSVPLVLQVLGY